MTFVFEGKEARNRNLFFVGDQFAFDNRTCPGDTFTWEIPQSGVLDFAFRVKRKGPFLRNGFNSADSAVAFGIVLDSAGRSGRLLLEDGRGRRDRDFDDMVVHFSLGVTPVPEVGTLGLTLAGLGAIGLLAHRRRRDLQQNAAVAPAIRG